MTERKVLISVIVPVYNVERYLERCIESILSQSIQDIEIILVNDGSEDNSLDVLLRYSKVDERIIIVSKINEGLSQSRNIGMSIAQGEYVGFVDSDDWIERDTYKQAYEVYKADKSIDIVCWGAKVHANTTDIDVTGSAKYHEIKLVGKYEIDDNILLNTTVTAWNKLYKRKIIEQNNIKFPYGLLYEDNVFFWKYMMHVEYAYFINEYNYNYNRRNGSIMMDSYQGKSCKYTDRIIGFEDVYEYYKKYDLNIEKKDLLKKLFNRAYENEKANSNSHEHVVRYGEYIKRKYSL